MMKLTNILKASSQVFNVEQEANVSGSFSDVDRLEQMCKDLQILKAIPGLYENQINLIIENLITVALKNPVDRIVSNTREATLEDGITPRPAFVSRQNTDHANFRAVAYIGDEHAIILNCEYPALSAALNQHPFCCGYDVIIDQDQPKYSISFVRGKEFRVNLFPDVRDMLNTFKYSDPDESGFSVVGSVTLPDQIKAFRAEEVIFSTKELDSHSEPIKAAWHKVILDVRDNYELEVRKVMEKLTEVVLAPCQFTLDERALDWEKSVFGVDDESSTYTLKVDGIEIIVSHLKDREPVIHMKRDFGFIKGKPSKELTLAMSHTYRSHIYQEISGEKSTIPAIMLSQLDEEQKRLAERYQDLGRTILENLFAEKYKDRKKFNWSSEKKVQKNSSLYNVFITDPARFNLQLDNGYSVCVQRDGGQIYDPSTYTITVRKNKLVIASENIGAKDYRISMLDRLVSQIEQ